MTKPLPPEDIDAERALLATACGDGNTNQAWETVLGLTAEDFMHPAHQALFVALGDVLRGLEAGGTVNSLLLKAELEKRKNLGKVGGYPGLVEILCGEEVGKVKPLIRHIKTLSQKRGFMRLNAKAYKSIEAGEDLDNVLTGAMDEIHRIQTSGVKVQSSSWSDMVRKLSSKEKFRPEGYGNQAGHWGLEGLDDSAPIPCGEVTLIAARPGVAKTALGVQIAAESAIQGKRVLFVSLELPTEILESRVVSYFLPDRSSRDYQRGDYFESAATELQKQASKLINGTTISLPQGSQWATIEAEIRQRQARYGLDLVIIDYFSYIGRPMVGKGSNEAYAYASVSDSITRLAKDTGLGIVLLAQLVKDADGRPPTLGDLADSDKPARDASVTLLVWQDTKEELHAQVKKNRHNPDKHWCRMIKFPQMGCRLEVFERDTHDTQKTSTTRLKKT